ncbi:MAG: TIGR02281 family clan AA aspartic protease [Paracoccaceae bacterium]|nr:TIGR02281 family clan AA aspartic protease [Paracoccaceae bacterium]
MLPEDPDAQARFFYLAILGSAIAIGLFVRYRGRFGAAMQHAAIWVLIFVGFTIAYGFKDQLASQLFPDQGLMQGAEAIVFRRADDGHFYAQARVEGTPIRFLIDTGATNIVLSQEDAARIGFDVNGLSYILPANTANGRVMGAGVTLDRIELGDFVDRDVRAVVNGGQLSDSLLGMSYLERFRSFEIEADRMTLRR